MDIVVIGGTRWSEDLNQPPQQAVDVLSKEHRVFYLYREFQSSALRNAFAPVDDRGRAAALRAIYGRTRFVRAEDNLWVAPVRGLAAALPMSHPERWRRRLVRR